MGSPERRTRHRIGRRLIDGVHVRFAPPIEGLWIGTFNLRWWEHLEHEHSKSEEEVARHAKTPQIPPAAKLSER